MRGAERILAWLCLSFCAAGGCAPEVSEGQKQKPPSVAVAPMSQEPAVPVFARVGEFCSEARGRACAPGLLCVDDPADGCESRPQAGTLCGGVCVVPEYCGGVAEFPCELGQICVDDPTDRCDPQRDGPGCDGLCAPKFCAPGTLPTCRPATLIGPVAVPAF